MTQPFLQLHFLTSYPASLLNRDDAGFAKRIPFGGASRTRVSSQCLKKHWRSFEGDHSLRAIELDGAEVPMSVRSRRTFERFVYEPLVQEHGVAPEIAAEVTAGLLEVVLGESAKAKASKAAKGEDKKEKDEVGRTGQITVLGRPELEYLLAEARAACAGATDAKSARQAVADRIRKDAKKNLQEMGRAAGLDAALFGRMVTSDILARGDAAVHVAHAFTVHAEASESDYFSVVDELLVNDDGERELGSGHIGSAELATGLYYGYVVVDLPLLVSNLEGCKREDWLGADRRLAAEVVSRLVWLLATVSPGAKVGSTAPYAYAHLVAAELGRSQPRSLANAFLQPVPSRGDLLAAAYGALSKHLGELDAMYSRSTERRFAALGPTNQLIGEALPEGSRTDLPGLAAWLAAEVKG